MALDFVVLGKDEDYLRHAGIGLDTHAEIITEAEKRNSPFLLRMLDYLEDAKYSVAELQALMRELEALPSSTSRSDRARQRVASMKEVVGFAIAEGCVVEAIAD